jgi:multidrug transporter EmrE-like cation transporter
MFANIVYVLCAATSSVCAALLFRGYRQSRARLLFWSALCFVGLALNNIMLVIDVRVVPTIDLSTWRVLPALVGVALLLYGLIWETR